LLKLKLIEVNLEKILDLYKKKYLNNTKLSSSDHTHSYKLNLIIAKNVINSKIDSVGLIE
jgi:hypothetical protein